MNSLFEIFHMVPIDRVLWRGTAGSVDEAQARVRELAVNSPGKYLVLCTRTGTGLVIDSDDSDLRTETGVGDSASA
jgi:hypothetical protein